jgi:hypothetical protein
MNLVAVGIWMLTILPMMLACARVDAPTSKADVQVTMHAEDQQCDLTVPLTGL